MRPLTRPLPRRGMRFRRPRPSRAVALAVAVAAIALIDPGTSRRVDGPTRPVWVTTTDLEPGDLIATRDVRATASPGELVPADVAGADPSGRVVRVRIGSGEIVVEHRLAGEGVDGTGALLGPDQRGVAVPRSGVDLGLAIGDHVDVLATLDPVAASLGGADATVVLAERVMVIAADDETVTVAVHRSEATTLAHAVVTATVTLTLAP